MATAIRMHKAGGPEVLEVEEVSVGAPGPGMVAQRPTKRGPPEPVSMRYMLTPRTTPRSPGSAQLAAKVSPWRMPMPVKVEPVPMTHWMV